MPSALHLFCPRQSKEDYDTYEDVAEVQTDGEDQKFDKERHDRIEDAKERRQGYLDCLQLFAYNEGHESKTKLQKLIDEAMRSCDLCIRQYHLAKKSYLRPKLRDDYEDPEVESFFTVIDQLDLDRICRGLADAVEHIRQMPPEKRRPGKLDRNHLLSLFEALSCEPFLKSEDLMKEYFDQPFELVQTKTPLRTNSYTSASIRFLFSNHPVRLRWAKVEWSKIDTPPTESEFEWLMKDFLAKQMEQTQLNPTASSVHTFWRAMTFILEKFEKDQITHNLRALDVDFCKLALENFAVDSPGFESLLQCFHRVLIVSPTDFWDAMGAIRPSTVVELICNNPQFSKSLNDARKDQPLELTGLGIALGWIQPFIASIKPAHLPIVCRTLIDQLLARPKRKEEPDAAKVQCFTTVMQVLEASLENFVLHDQLRSQTPRGVLTEMIDLVTDHIGIILQPIHYQVYPDAIETARNTALTVVRLALALEVQNLKNDFETLSSDRKLSHSATSYSKVLWDSVIARLDDLDTSLSTTALSGMFPLPGLEELAIRPQFEATNEARKSFNKVFQKFTTIFGTVLERLGEFSPEHLDELFKNENTSMILISGLSFSDDTVYQAASDLIKSVSGQPGRQEAMAHLLQAFLATTLNGLSYTFRRLAKMRTFAGVPRMIKTGMDVLDILCDSQTGLLRTQKYNRQDRVAVQKYWEYQWQELSVVFRSTERWYSPDKEFMKEFCRDTMQYAEALYEQYSVFANMVVDGNSQLLVDKGKGMLDATDHSPAATIDSMVKWLRLRDDYLVNTLVKLLSKLLHRLGDENAKISDNALIYIEEAVIHGHVRTNLTQQHKAELVRSLETYKKEPYPPPATKKKQKKLQDFVWNTDRTDQNSSKEDFDDYGDDDLADDDLIELSRDLEAKKPAPKAGTQQRLQPVKGLKPLQPQSSKEPKPLAKPRPTAPPLSVGAGKSQFLIQREKEREEIKRRNAEAAARLRGNRGIGAQTKGQGSGLAGIGVEGKDHNDPANDMMVSSDSESDSEDEIDKELFGSLKGSGSRRLNRQVFPNMTKKQPTGPIKKIKQLRSAKDMRARLAPDLSSLHRTILGWDFFAEGDLPPNASKDGYTLVSNAFRSALEYQRTFEPLLILESWQSFRSAREEGAFKPFEIKVANRISVDNFVEISTSMSLQESRDLQLRESDVVLLSSAKQPWKDPSQPHCLARIMRAGVKKGEREIVYRLVSGNKLSGLLSPGTNLWGASILSLTPLEREYGGLSALQYYDLCDEILKAKPSPLLEYGEDVLSSFVENYNVNIAQAKAIKSALDNDAFTLIQGPPGSGKTKTICALVGAIMSSNLPAQASSTQAANTSNLSTAKKVLVCAPSNAAVDELVMRFKSGVKTMSGKEEKINVVRLGRSDAINAAVKDLTIDELVNAKINAAVPVDPGRKDLGELMNLHKEASDKVVEVRSRMDQTRARGQPVNPADSQEFEGWKRKKADLGTQIDRERDKKNSVQRDMDVARRKIQQEIIDNAHILCATLSGSGHEMFQNLNIEFDVVIIDEAAQSVELSALIPLKYGCSKCVLVGDPRQLPPTVLSKAASKYAYEQSLFARMEKNHPKDVHLLDTQYRMHPEISAFPSREFYESRLKDGPNMARLRTQPWHNSSALGPYRFFDVQGMHSSAPKGHSLVNQAEANVALKLYERLTTDCRQIDFRGKVGIITPYKGQLKELRLRFSQRYGEGILKAVEFNTTDAFQGRECEIIIFSCVRASLKSIGFLDDVRRMNVGLTRAKSSLWVLGNSQSLMIGEYWKKLVLDAKARSLYTEGDIMALLQRPQLTLDMIRPDVEMIDVRSASPSSNKTPSARPTPTTSKPPTPVVPPTGPKSRVASASTEKSSPVPSRPSSSHSSSGRPSLPSRSASAQSVASFSTNHRPSSADIEVRRVEGRAGGANGLNDAAFCGFCGSADHQTRNCDDEDARVQARGRCDRCQSGAHDTRDCNTIRCLDCGAFGHGAQTCTATPAGKSEKQRIARQEEHHRHKQQGRLEKARKRQLGEHGATVPVVQTSLAPSTSASSSTPASSRKPPSGPKGIILPGRKTSSSSTSSMMGQGSTFSTSPPSSVSVSGSGSHPPAKRKRSEDDISPPNGPKSNRNNTPTSTSTNKNKMPRPPVSANPLASLGRPVHKPTATSATNNKQVHLSSSSTDPSSTTKPTGTQSSASGLAGGPTPRPNIPGYIPPGSKGVMKRPKAKEDDLFMRPKKR